MSDFVTETMALTRRWLLHLKRQRATMIIGILQPLVWLVLFGSLFGKVAQGRGGQFYTEDYLTFQTAGVLVMTVLGNAFMGGIPILFDRETGFLDKLLVAPISRAALFTSRFLYVVVFSMGQVAVVLAVAWLMGVRLAGGWMALVDITIYGSLLAAAFTIQSLALAFVFKHHAAYFAISGFLLTPFIFLSSALLPLTLMPDWLVVVATINPLTHAIEPIRAAIVGGYAEASWLDPQRHLIYLIGFTVISMVWGLGVLRRAVD